MGVEDVAKGCCVPAKDYYHDTVIQALRRDGWRVTDEQVPVLVGDRRLWIDIRARHDEAALVIFVEVKGLENQPSPVEYLAGVLGKYMLYRASLDALGVVDPLFLAVPVDAYTGILSEAIGQLSVEIGRLSLLIFDPSHAEVVAWIPSEQP